MDDDIRGIVRQFIIDDLGGGEALPGLGDEASLREQGILDSLSTLKLVTFLEHRFGLRLEAADLSANRLASLASIETIVKARRASLT